MRSDQQNGFGHQTAGQIRACLRSSAREWPEGKTPTIGRDGTGGDVSQSTREACAKPGEAIAEYSAAAPGPMAVRLDEAAIEIC